MFIIENGVDFIVHLQGHTKELIIYTVCKRIFFFKYAISFSKY